MLIRCPECDFTRQINERKIPAGSEFATCPKCKRRFRFRTLETPAPDDTAPRPAAQPTGPEETERRTPPPSRPETPPASEKPDDVWSAVENLGGNWEKEKERQPDDEPEDWRPDDDQAEPDFEERGADADEERRREAAEAYRRQEAYGKKPSLLANAGSVPWEYRGGFLTPQGFLRTVALSFTRIPEFFGGIPARGSLGPALVFALLLRGLQLGMVFLFTRVRIQGEDGLITEKTLTELANASLPELIITILFISILAQFISAALISLMIRLVEREKADFRLTFKVLAYSMTPLVFVLIPQVGFMIAEIGSLVFLVLGLRHAFKFRWSQVVVVLSVPFVLMILMSLRLASMF